MTLDELLSIDLDEGSAFLYGFVKSNVEKVLHFPSRDSSGCTRFDENPMEWSFPEMHLYGVAEPLTFADVGLNLQGDEDGVELREAYGNITINQALKLRAGTMYRRFGLFRAPREAVCCRG